MAFFPRWVALIAVVIVAFVLSSAAQAADHCDDVFVDQTRDQVLHDRARIDAATARLENLGADIRIRAYDAAPGGNLDAYEASQVSSCASWRGPDGQTKGNLVVLLFSMDHQSAIFYGSNWHPSLDRNVDRVRADAMNPQLRAGKFADGVARAEDELFRLMDHQLHPEESGSPWPGAMLLLAIAAAYGGWFLKRRRDNRQVRESERSVAKAAALRERDEAVDALLALDSADDVHRHVKILVGNLNPQDAAALNMTWKTAEAAVNAAFTEHGQITDDGDRYDPDRWHTREEYRDIAAAYEQVKTSAVAAAALLRATGEQCDQLREEMAHAPEALAHLKGKRSAISQTDQRLQSEGYLTSIASSLHLANRALSTAEKQLDEHQAGQAIVSLRQAQKAYSTLEKYLDGLPALPRELAIRHKELEAELSTTEQSVALTQAWLDEMGRTYCRACWDDVMQEFSRAAAGLVRARAELDPAQDDISMQSQRWEQGEDRLISAQTLLDAYAEARVAVAERRELLDDLARTAGARVESLRADDREARTEIASLRGDQARYLQQLNSWTDRAEALEDELRSPQPDYLTIEAELRAISNGLREAVEEARNENQARQRERRERRGRISAFLWGGWGSGAEGGSSWGAGGGSSGSWGGDAGGGSSGGW